MSTNHRISFEDEDQNFDFDSILIATEKYILLEQCIFRHWLAKYTHGCVLFSMINVIEKLQLLWITYYMDFTVSVQRM